MKADSVYESHPVISVIVLRCSPFVGSHDHHRLISHHYYTGYTCHSQPNQTSHLIAPTNLPAT